MVVFTETVRSEKRIQSTGSRSFLSCSSDPKNSTVDLWTSNDGSGRQVWVLTPATSPNSYVVSAKGGRGNGPNLLSASQDGKRVGLYAKNDGSGRQVWDIKQVSGNTFEVSISGGKGLSKPSARVLTLNDSTPGGSLFLDVPYKSTEAKRALQLWRFDGASIVPSGGRIVHTNFTIDNPTGASVSSTAGTFSNPISSVGKAADPGIFRDSSGTYYMSLTENGVIYKSRDLVNWTRSGSLTAEVWFYWAPEIMKSPSVPGGYACVFCNGVEDTRVLSGPSPNGPFKPYAKLGRPGGGFPMDPHVFRDEDGQHYLYTSAFGTVGGIQVRKISADLKTVDSKFATCVRVLQQPWWMVELVTEGPQVLKRVVGGKATYYLVFTSNASSKKPCYYSIGYATASHPMGPWTLAPENPVLKWDSKYGYGHHAFTVGPNGGLCALFNRDPGSFDRRLAMTAVTFSSDGKLVFDTKMDGQKKLP